jgi:hypothetical protein
MKIDLTLDEILLIEMAEHLRICISKMEQWYKSGFLKTDMLSV